MNWFAHLTLTALATAIGGCGASAPTDQGEPPTAQIRSHLQLPGITPIPWNYDANEPAFAGNAVDLMFADAFAACVRRSDREIEKRTFDDEYLLALKAKILNTKCSYTPDSGDAYQKEVTPGFEVEDWIAIRENPVCNKDPSTGQLTAVKIDQTTALPAAEGDAAYYLLAPSVSHCIAHRLRTIAPGASGAEASLLSGSEQIQLQYHVQDRIQRAILGYSLLDMMFMTKPFADNDPCEGDLCIQSPERKLALWASQNGASVSQIGADWAAALSLHATVSSEMAEMLVRALNARAPRGGKASTAAAQEWDQASWRQRATALLYGGYYLAHEADNSSPWVEPAGRTQPSYYCVSDKGRTITGQWPNRGESPYPQYEIRSAETHAFKAMTMSLGTVPLVLADPERQGCRDVDVNSSGDGLYRQVEWTLRGCFASKTSDEQDACKQLYDPIDAVDTSKAGKSILWTSYGIRREHAVEYAEYLADHLEPICRKSGTSTLRSGTSSLLGDIALDPLSTTKVVLTNGATVVSKALEDRVPAYSQLMSWRMPKTAGRDWVDYPALPLIDGSDEWAWAQERVAYHGRMGSLGAISAQVAVREALHSSYVAQTEVVDWSSTRVQIYNALVKPHLKSMLGIIAGAVGERSISLRSQHPNQGQSAGKANWEVDIVVPVADAFWNSSTDLKLCVTPNDPWAFNRVAHPGTAAFGKTGVAPCANEALIVSDLDAMSEEEKAAGLRRFHATFSVDESYVEKYTSPQDISFYPVQDSAFTITAHKASEGRALLGKFTYPEPLVISDAARSYLRYQGQYIATGGKLGLFAERLWTPRGDNPVAAAFDAFGIPTNWVPPSDPTLIGAGAGEESTIHYLATAKASAQEATSAVNSAFESLLDQEADEAAAKAAESRASEVNRLEEAALCGEKNPKCLDKLVLNEVPVLEWDVSWLRGLYASCPNGFPDAPPDPTVSKNANFARALLCVFEWGLSGSSTTPECLDSVSNQGKESLSTFSNMLLAGLGGKSVLPHLTAGDYANASAVYCQAIDTLEAVAGPPPDDAIQASFDKTHPWGSLRVVQPDVRVKVAAEVAGLLNAGMQPSFSAFEGGSLQSAFIDQWASFRQVKLLAGEYVNASWSAVQKVLAARAIANAATDSYLQSCNPTQLALANAACVTVSGGFPAGYSFSFNPAPLTQYMNNCAKLAADCGPAVQNAEAEQQEAIARVASYGTQFAERVKSLHLSCARVLQMIHDASLAKRKNDLEADLVKQTQTTSFTLYRRYHSYDLWRAKALVENARRQSVVARRAIEARFGVDLSRMNGVEPFVAPPSMWADDVYSFDLSLPAAVGLSLGSAEPGGIYPNKVLDYVENLEKFTQGFAVSRPSAAAREDTELISLPGPYMTRFVVNGYSGGEDVPATMVVPEVNARRWEVLCPGDPPEWSRIEESSLEKTSGGEVTSSPHWDETPCGVGEFDVAVSPLRARMTFMLDPWGRIEGAIANPPYEKRYNTRWARLAINIAGTGVLDCSKSSDPLNCYSQAFVRYNLNQAGPAWITTHDQDWHTLGVPLGRIEGAKALAIEQWLDPLTNSWGKPYVDAAQRTEFTNRPLGGAYELVFELGPEVRLQQIERVQILLSTTYWVQQE